jgi:hypothetical protein
LKAIPSRDMLGGGEGQVNERRGVGRISEG